jgi:heme exporter protein CcmD
VIGAGTELAYIVGAYVGVGLVTLLLIGWVWRDSRRVKARLRDLEAQGIRRRSAGAA